jgi:hypothetical protein
MIYLPLLLEACLPVRKRVSAHIALWFSKRKGLRGGGLGYGNSGYMGNTTGQVLTLHTDSIYVYGEELEGAHLSLGI